MGEAGGLYPRSTASAIYQDGVIWAGFVEGDTLPRACGQYYSFVGTASGWINPDGTPADPDDPKVRIYRIRRDYQTLTFDQVKQDAAEQLLKPLDEVTEEDVQNIIDQYARDWQEWPVEHGAPFMDRDGNGLFTPGVDEPGYANADQAVWFVANDLDDRMVLHSFGSPPIGLELQVTVWSYNQPSYPVGQCVFKRYLLINKSGQKIDSMYIGQWSDPDIGDYPDDLVGCDSLNNLEYAYSAYPTDREYDKFGLPPAAAGYILLQGPWVYTGNPADTAIFNLRPRTGYRNLPMTSFVFQFPDYQYYGFPRPGNENNIAERGLARCWYNVLRGFIPTDDLQNPSSYVHGAGPYQGRPTKFPLNGDPVQGTGDVDGMGNNYPPRDAKMMMSTGPFTMLPGDTQEVMVAVVGGIVPEEGGNNLNAILQMKYNSLFARFLHRKLFQGLPKPPREPVVDVMTTSREIVLNWGSHLAAVAETESNDLLSGFNFEGYNVYQLPGPVADKSQAKLLATFDLKNGVKDIWGMKYVPQYRKFIRVPLQSGSDSGIQRFFIVEKDYLHNRPLYAGSKYYFAVTAYNYNPDPSLPEPTLESALVPIEVIPQPEPPGVKYEGSVGQELEVSRNKETDGTVRVFVVDPSRCTGHEYEIFFTRDADSSSATDGELFWNLRDKTTGEMKLEHQRISSDTTTANDQLIVDGLLIQVISPKPGIKAIVEIANRNGPLPPEDWDSEGAPYQGNNVWHSLNAPSDLNRFYLSAGGGDGSIERHMRSIANSEGHDYEMRFTQEGGIYVWWYNDSTWAQVPFEWWDIGYSTPDDPSDDVRGLTGGYSGGTETGPNGFKFDYVDPAFRYPATDWIYLRIPLDEQGTYDVFYNDITSGTLSFDWWDHSKEVLAHLIICDFSGTGTLPETGTVIRWITKKTFTEEDILTFKAPGVQKSLELARQAVEKINVFPNPYYAFNPQATNRFDQFVTFTHLPRKATIRIFNLAGTQVRKLEKNDDSQFFKWDLLNESGLPVASGIYIAYIDLPDLKKTKVLKIFIVQRQQILQYY